MSNTQPCKDNPKNAPDYLTLTRAENGWILRAWPDSSIARHGLCGPDDRSALVFNSVGQLCVGLSALLDPPPAPPPVAEKWPKLPAGHRLLAPGETIKKGDLASFDKLEWGPMDGLIGSKVRPSEHGRLCRLIRWHSQRRRFMDEGEKVPTQGNPKCYYPSSRCWVPAAPGVTVCADDSWTVDHPDPL